MELNASLTNVWLLLIPFIILSFYVPIFRKDVAKRMADMCGYSSRERTITIISSIMPYPFMLYTVFLPFTKSLPLIISGAVIYLAGMIMFISAIVTMLKTPAEGIFQKGPYRISRNPMYLSAGLIFIGISLLSTNPSVILYLLVMFIFQHFMILAEERVCRENFGAPFIEYMRSTPRYLIF